ADVEGQGERPGRGRVVDVVEAWDRHPHPSRASRRLEREADAVEAVRVDIARGDVERGACVAAGGPGVRAQVADVDGVVAVGMTTTNAVLRVGRVLEAGPRPRGVVDP